MSSRRETLPAGVSATPAAPALTRALFTPLVETTFELEPPEGGRRAVTLVGVPGSERAFALHFSTRERVAEGTYRVHHPALPSVDLFLAPTGPDPGRIEAVVNRREA